MAMEWDIYIANEVRDWLDKLDDVTHARVVQAVDALAEGGPGLGRPLVDTIARSQMQNLKDLLVAGDMAGQWRTWYESAIPLAEHRCEIHLKERRAEEGGP